jgi:hypothetical protein
MGDTSNEVYGGGVTIWFIGAESIPFMRNQESTEQQIPCLNCCPGSPDGGYMATRKVFIEHSLTIRPAYETFMGI